MPEGSPTPKKPIHKKWWFWAIIMFMLYSIGSSGGKPTPTPTNDVAESTTTPPSAVPAPEQPPKPLTQMDKLWAALDASAGKRDGYDLRFDDKTGIVTVTETPKTVWDENAIVRRAYANLVAYGMEAFKLEGVRAVQSVVIGSFTDEYGKKANEDAARLTMAKEEFAKYEWSNLYYKPVWQQMKQSSADYYIHAGLIAGISSEKLYLTKP